MLRQAVFFLLLVEVSRASIILGQLSGTLSTNRVYQANTEITEFQADKAMQGFTHENGRLKVQKCGFYYIYAQVFFTPHSSASQNRVALSVNGAQFGLMQAGLGGSAGYGTLFTAGVIHLHEGDYISLITHYESNLWVSRAHSFFGAYRIGE